MFCKRRIINVLTALFSLTNGGIKLQVTQDDEEDALKILKDAGYLND